MNCDVEFPVIRELRGFGNFPTVARYHPGYEQGCTARVFVISCAFGVFNMFRSGVDERRPTGASQTRETLQRRVMADAAILVNQ